MFPPETEVSPLKPVINSEFNQLWALIACVVHLECFGTT